jgi:hypothetical protein
MTPDDADSNSKQPINNFTDLVKSYTKYLNSSSSFFKTFKFTRSFKYFIYILIPFIFIYGFGFIFNNLQNPNILFSGAWFYDSIFLSWSNLLVLPIFVLIIMRGILRRTQWASDSFILILIHLISPLFWIVGYLLFRTFIKTIETFVEIISRFLKYLAE